MFACQHEHEKSNETKPIDLNDFVISNVDNKVRFINSMKYARDKFTKTKVEKAAITRIISRIQDEKSNN